jgi:hypothetical protein
LQESGASEHPSIKGNETVQETDDCLLLLLLLLLRLPLYYYYYYYYHHHHHHAMRTTKFSSPMVLQPNLGLGLFNPPPPSISVLCQPSGILAL